jgi:cytochrome P450
MTTGIDWIDDISIDELEKDPYPFYARMRKETPCVFVPVLNAYFLTTYDEVRDFLADADLSHAPSPQPVLERTFGPNNILVTNGDIHHSQRKFVDPPLRRGAVSKYIDDLVRPIAKQATSAVESSTGSFDLVERYLEPVSVLSLAAMLGIPDISADTLRRWFHTMIRSASNYTFAEEPFEAGEVVVEEIRDTLEPILRRLEVHPDNSGLSHLLHAGMPEGQIRPREEIYPAFLIELIGGLQEPGHAMSSTLLGLLMEDQYKLIVDQPDRIPSALAEGLRWIAPIGATFRQTTRATVIHGQEIAEGSIVYCIVASANHDESKFSDGGRYDINRSGPSHLSFGGGVHFCAGNVFGREVARIAMEELVQAAPKLTLADEGFTMRGWLFRAPQTLHVTVGKD